jgi:glc operon protein GlcG
MNRLITLAILVLMSATAQAQQPLPEYGPEITVDQAKKVVAAAEAEAKKQKWPVAITIVDTHGDLVMFEKLDQTQYGSIEISMEKAKTAAHFRKPSKAFEDQIAQGGQYLRLTRHPAIPIEGGVPIFVDGKVIGAIGVSGVKSNEDGIVAQAGADALKPSK